MAIYHTIRHIDTHEPLGGGGPLDRAEALSIIGLRRSVIVGGRERPFVKSEWYVTGWNGDGADDDEIEFQVSADEFAHRKGLV